MLLVYPLPARPLLGVKVTEAPATGWRLLPVTTWPLTVTFSDWALPLAVRTISFCAGPAHRLSSERGAAVTTSGSTSSRQGLPTTQEKMVPIV